MSVFMSHSAHDKALLDSVIHGGSLHGTSVDAITAGILVDAIAGLSEAEKVYRISNKFRNYVDVPHHGGLVANSGNHDSTADLDFVDYHVRDLKITRELVEVRIIEALSHTNVDRVAISVPSDPTKQVSMPVNMAGVISIFMSGQNRESFIGDLQERYSAIFESEGRRKATLWFWRELISSLFSLSVQSIKRLSGFEKLVARYRRIGR